MKEILHFRLFELRYDPHNRPQQKHSYGGVNSHIQNLSKTICVEICPSAPKACQKIFWEFPVFFRESRKIVGNSENFGTAVIKSILIITNYVITDRGTTSCMLNVDFTLNVVRL